ELKKQISCSLQVSNKTENHVAFKVKTMDPKKYCVRPNTGIVLPRSKCDITGSLLIIYFLRELGKFFLLDFVRMLFHIYVWENICCLTLLDSIPSKIFKIVGEFWIFKNKAGCPIVIFGEFSK
ncbi:vesicle-associated 1-2-like, partial [Olea europaea subsp. europaea]